MFDDVELRIKKKNKILFSRESKSLQNLQGAICRQTHLTLVFWAFDCLQIPMRELMLKYPEESDIQSAYDVCLAWAHGTVKMPPAKKAILHCHAVAKRLHNDYDIALCHAVGQGCAAVHVETHALGLVFYELTALVIQCGYLNYEEIVSEKISCYAHRLAWWEANAEQYRFQEKWADFLLRPEAENKEKVLNKKLSEK